MQTQEPFYSARRLFPRGLEQPPGSLRLARMPFAGGLCCTRDRSHERSAAQQLTAAELGCGCGAALLALALRCGTVTGLGLKWRPPL